MPILTQRVKTPSVTNYFPYITHYNSPKNLCISIWLAYILGLGTTLLVKNLFPYLIKYKYITPWLFCFILSIRLLVMQIFILQGIRCKPQIPQASTPCGARPCKQPKELSPVTIGQADQLDDEVWRHLLTQSGQSTPSDYLLINNHSRS